MEDTTNTIENETEENAEAIATAKAITANISRVDHNITVGARFPRPYNVARVQLKTAVTIGAGDRLGVKVQFNLTAVIADN